MKMREVAGHRESNAISCPLYGKPEAGEMEAVQAEEEERWKQLTVGKIWVTAKLYRRQTYSWDFLDASERKLAAQLVGNRPVKDVVFDRREDGYRMDQRVVTKLGVVSELYNEAGYKPMAK